MVTAIQAFHHWLEITVTTGAAVAELVPVVRWASDLQVERSILLCVFGVFHNENSPH